MYDVEIVLTMWLLQVNQIWDLSSNQKILRILRWFTWILWAENPNLWGSVYGIAVIGLLTIKDYVYIHFIYRNYLSVLPKIPNQVMEWVK